MVPASRDLVAYRLELFTKRLYLYERHIGGRILTENVSRDAYASAVFRQLEIPRYDLSTLWDCEQSDDCRCSSLERTEMMTARFKHHEMTMVTEMRAMNLSVPS